MKTFLDYLVETENNWGNPAVGDAIDFIINEELCIECDVQELTEDGVIVDLEEFAVAILESVEQLAELSPKIKSTYAKAAQQDMARHAAAAKTRRYVYGPEDSEAEEHEREAERRERGLTRAQSQASMTEAEYQGREVQLGKPMQGDVKKFKVYVKDPSTGNVKKVNFGDPNMEIRRDDPERRKSFRARHGCGTSRASDRTKAAYWSCRMWSSKPVSKIVSEQKTTQMRRHHEDVGVGAYRARDVGGYDRIYHMNRLMMAMAKADGQSTRAVDSPADTWFEKYNTIHPYTEQEHNMAQAAMKTVPTDGKEVTRDHRSHETETVHKTSPVPQNSGAKTKRKSR